MLTFKFATVAALVALFQVTFAQDLKINTLCVPYSNQLLRYVC